MVLPPTLARLGDLTERRLAPRFYRRSRVVTLSESSRTEIVDMLGLAPDTGHRGASRHRQPLQPGRPALAGAPGGGRRPPGAGQALRRPPAGPGHGEGEQPDLRAVIVGEGYERPALEALRDELGATDWVDLPGRVSEEELVSWYRHAWVVASSSQREGWGMTLTEAAACGTPAVATAIAGHADAVVDGESGLLVDDVADLAPALARVLSDDVLRSRLSKGALQRARWFTWDATALRALEALAEEAAAPAER